MILPATSSMTSVQKLAIKTTTLALITFSMHAETFLWKIKKEQNAPLSLLFSLMDYSLAWTLKSVPLFSAFYNRF